MTLLKCKGVTQMENQLNFEVVSDEELEEISGGRIDGWATAGRLAGNIAVGAAGGLAFGGPVGLAGGIIGGMATGFLAGPVKRR
ncbi:Uncharacterized protein LLA12_PI00006 (plasmid) [Lactococcus lactis subsp. lactis]|nr:Uncharacterized protein LLA12_PI00006 [Lactococcus lactis subsp. lactis]